MVGTPLDVSMLKQDICKAMTEEQAKTFPGTLTGNEVEHDGESDYCVWNYEGERYLLGSITGGLEIDNDQGLTQYYKQKATGSWDVKPIDPIAGYPAVIHDVGMQSIGGCVIAVGVRNDLVYTASTQLGHGHPSRDTPCKAARKLAGLVIQNLKEAQ